MRAAFNILFAFLLLLMQGTAAVAPHSITKKAVCRCCSCGGNACTTPQTSPAPAPSPLVVQEATRQSEQPERSVSKAAPISSPMPRLFAASTATFLSCPADQPLYERFCVLLI